MSPAGPGGEGELRRGEGLLQFQQSTLGASSSLESILSMNQAALESVKAAPQNG